MSLTDYAGPLAIGTQLFDITELVKQAMIAFLKWIVESAFDDVFDAIAGSIMSSPDLTNDERVKAFWTSSLVAANASFVLLIVTAGLVVSARETLQSRYGLKDLIRRLIVAAVAANTSLIVIGKLIEGVNALTVAIAGGDAISGTGIAETYTSAFTESMSGDSFLAIMLGLAALVMGTCVLSTFVLRIAVLVILIGAAPIALSCHALPYTEQIAFMWWRAITACFMIQLAQALVIIATVTVFFTPDGVSQIVGGPDSTSDLIGMLLALVMLWLLMKIPSWAKYMIFGRTGGKEIVRQVVSAIIMIKTLGAMSAAKGAAGAAGSVGVRAGGALRTGTASVPSPSAPPALPRSGTKPELGGGSGAPGPMLPGGSPPKPIPGRGWPQALPSSPTGSLPAITATPHRPPPMPTMPPSADSEEQRKRPQGPPTKPGGTPDGTR